MATVFDKILDTTTGRKSYDWYKRKVQAMTTPSAKTLISQGKATLRPKYGVMNLFGYDPKHKDKLPYYDIFPLIFPLEPAKGGFIGLNFHYLPYGARFAFLQQLQSFASNSKFDQSTKIQATYKQVKSNKYVKASIKKYLYSQVRSNFLRIDVNEMALAAYLPVADFQGATLGQVFARTRRTY